MKLSYNVTGAQRKTLVAAVSQELNATAKYLGMPSAAYEIGDYTIDKAGTLIGKDNLDLEDALHQKGFDAEPREYDEPDTYESGLGDMGAVDAPPTEELHMKHYRAEISDPDYPDRMEIFSAENDEDAVRQALEFCEGKIILLELHELDDDYELARGVDLSKSGGFSIDLPLDTLTPAQFETLGKLVDSRASLIKKAVGTDDLPIVQTEDGKLRFAWFPYTDDAAEINAYTTLVLQLCKAAKEQKRVTAKEKPVDNEKFTFRVFLIRLGFVGDEYKADRKFLLRNLTGNSAFKNGAPKKESEGDSDE